MKHAFKIDKNVPIPSRSKHTVSKYPFAQLEVGDSFFAPGKKNTGFSGIVQNFYRNHRDKTDCKFSIRTVVEKGVKGVRIWRVK